MPLQKHARSSRKCPNRSKHKRLPAELTRTELDQQDEVDNAIHNLIEDLATPFMEGTPGFNPDDPVEWDIEDISNIREAVQDVLVKKLKVCTEMQFYPYRVLRQPKPKPGDDIYASIKCKVGAPCDALHVLPKPNPFALGISQDLIFCKFDGFNIIWSVELPAVFFVRNLKGHAREFCVVHKPSGGLLGDGKTLSEAVGVAIVNIARTPDLVEQAVKLIEARYRWKEISQEEYNGYTFK
jgi:hypothetical protein